jgi:phage-related protein
MKNEDKQNDGGSPLRNIVLVIKNFFTKILSQSDGLSVKSLAIANNWKKKLAPIVIKYIKELLPFIKRMKDSTTMLARKTGAKTIELSLRIKRFLPNFISGFLGKIFKHVSGFLGKMFRYISAIVRTCFNKIKLPLLSSSLQSYNMVN